MDCDNDGAGAAKADPGKAGATGSVERGRQEMISRRMFALKRFDSAEFFSKASEGRGREYLGDLAKTEAYEKEHHLDHEHFTAHSVLAKHQPSGKHPLQRRMSRRTPPADGEGTRALLRRRIHHTRRFDSGDYFMGLQPEEEVVATSPTPRSPSGPPTLSPALDHSTAKADSGAMGGAPSLGLPPRAPGPALTPAPAPTPATAPGAGAGSAQGPHGAARAGGTNAVARRFLRKGGGRKRWDSGDYNVLIDATAARLPTVPDLDIMSVSSGGEAESKDEPRSLSAAQELIQHQESKRSKRFDSADYFRGMSPPSQELEVSPFDQPRQSPPHSARSPPPSSSLGSGTLEQRDACAEKAQRRKDFEVS